MLIVDAQAHVWAPDSRDRPWRSGEGGLAHRRAPVGAEELCRVMDRAAVARCVLVPPSWEGDRNDVALAAAAARPDRFKVMGRFPIESAAATALLPTWREQNGMLGVRLTLHRDPWRRAFAEGGFGAFWAAAEREGLPVMVYPPGLLGPLARVAGRHGGLRLIIDHLALPVGAFDEAAYADLDALLALARFSNVAVKVSALPCHTRAPYPFAGLHPLVRRVYDAFGPRRMLWGSDHSRLPCSYEQSIGLFTEAIDFLSSDDKAWIMGRAAMDWLDWPSHEASRECAHEERSSYVTRA